jgi:hypothetical protein
VRPGAIACEIRRHEDRIRTQAFRSFCWHGRMNAEAPGLVRSSADHRAVAQPSNDHRLAAQLRIIALLDRSVKRVHVDMDDFSHDLTPTNTIPGSEKAEYVSRRFVSSITLLLDLRSGGCVAAIVCPDASN